MNSKRTLQNCAFVQTLPEIFREVLKSLTPKAFGIDQNHWFCKALSNIVLILNYNWLKGKRLHDF